MIDEDIRQATIEGSVLRLRPKLMTLRSTGCLLALVLGAMTSASSATAQTLGTFTPTGTMTTARKFHTATLLRDGKVLIVGGGGVSAEIYDPATRTFAKTGDLTTARTNPTATLLDDGRVLIVGGDLFTSIDPPTAPPTTTAELFNPSTGTFTRTPDLVTVQIYGTATLLKSGKVLIAGGIQSLGDFIPITGGWLQITPPIVANPELYDPSTATFALTGPFRSKGDGLFVTGGPNVSAATLLSDGRVLIAGEPDSELYDPVTGTFSVTGPMTTPCFLGGNPQYIAGRTATLLVSGKVLEAGGEHEDCGRFANAELYDPATGTFVATGSMTRPRDNHTATLLPMGTVLITGGESEACVGNGCSFSGTEASAEIYDAATGMFSKTGDLSVLRAGHTATLLRDGTVLITGGYAYAGIGGYSCCFASAELYTPPVLVPAPTLLSLSGDGQGPGAIIRAGTALVSFRTGAMFGEVTSSSHPAAVGEALEIYCLGLGDGSSRIPPAVTIGGRRAEILSVRNVPGVAGAGQVTVRVPEGVTPGPAVAVRLTYLGRTSNEVTIGVR
jgi:hypothetical protein